MSPLRSLLSVTLSKVSPMIAINMFKNTMLVKNVAIIKYSHMIWVDLELWNYSKLNLPRPSRYWFARASQTGEVVYWLASGWYSSASPSKANL